MCRVEYADGMSLILGAEKPKARKPHRCYECGRSINTGEHYLRERGIFDHEAFTHKTCQHCQIGRRWLSRECGGWIFGEIQEELREHWDEVRDYRTRELARLIYGMRRQWQARKGGLMPVPKLSNALTKEG